LISRNGNRYKVFDDSGCTHQFKFLKDSIKNSLSTFEGIESFRPIRLKCPAHKSQTLLLPD